MERSKIELANGDKRIFDGLGCSFYTENLKTALFYNTFIYKLKVTSALGWSYIGIDTLLCVGLVQGKNERSY